MPGSVQRAGALAGYPLRLPAMPLHDPWIVADRAAGLYHLYTTNLPAMTGDSRLGIMAYTSPDLAHWARPRVVFTLPEDSWANDGAWAPEVHRWKGRWYLFATFYNDAAPLPAHDGRHPVRRATLLASAESLDGPFALENDGAPLADPARMTLDGTLYRAPDGRPWLVYAHEWVQVGDGTIEAVPLDDTLRRAGDAITLFRASDAPWVKRPARADEVANFVTDGPELFRTRTGALLMLWSSYDAQGYVQALAQSASGKLEGPWRQLEPLVRADSGHGMLFERFDGQLMMVLHRPFHNARGKLYEMRDEGDRLRVLREATWLDGETHPTHP
ncbi:glycoside hydrolase family 43 protein [Novosphingobium sp. 1949]|uniref:Glycoside hydrolase family 43 protein n=1 Tax=Novosphingobium organovorum TaxID=2930092 RepID=A0ABT0B8C3_9SPHN|nr:glycoside hydrolase family 43 protein [Novosphingobium organovorum]MCJ2181273.1 glycoside hydrolase family 43 protein [Novosphingobium organovorum]